MEVCLLLGIVVLARLVASQWVHVYDDAFITYRYARNWAEGLGMTFNPGSPWEPILGTTTPGYTAVLALLMWAGMGAVQASLTFNTVMDLVSALLLLRLGGRSRQVAGVAVFGFALMPELVRISVGGMEAPALVALTLATCLCLRERRPALAGVASALACTLRPEAVLLVLVVGAGLRRERRELVRFAVPVLVIGAVYAALLTWYFGSPIPQSVRSKARRHSGSPWRETWMEILQQGLLPRMEYLLLVPFLFKGLGKVLGRECVLRPLVLFGGAILAAYLAARPHTWGWYYAIPLTAWLVAVAHGLGDLVGSRLAEETVAHLSRAVLLLTAFGIGLFGLLGSPEDLVTTRVYRPLESWARAEGLEGFEHTILASDIGAVGFYAQGRILDTEGLTWPEAEAHGKQVDKILEHRPDYVLLTAVAVKREPFEASQAVCELYEPILRLSVAGESDLEPSSEDLSRKWMQDYLLYRRRDL